MHPAVIAASRFGLGARADEPLPASPRDWLLGQLDRYEPHLEPWATVPPPGELLERFDRLQREVAALPEAERASGRLVQRQEVVRNYVDGAGARMGCALRSPTPFMERLVHFWSNHFAISTEKLQVQMLAGSFEKAAIRPYVLGRFRDMLQAVLTHPAMLIYLDQAGSVGPNSIAAARASRARGLNENLAREILELHTLGVRGGYSQADVTELARALTGWALAGRRSATGGSTGPSLSGGPSEVQTGFEFRPHLHEPGQRTVLGRTYAQTDQHQAGAILDDVVASRATARHVAFKLARHFIADEPPAAAVDRLAEVFQKSGGDLTAVYRALVASPEAWTATPAKFKSPWEWMVSGLRALGVPELPGQQVVNLLLQLGQPVWRPGSPAGFDDLAASWAAPDALLRRVEVAHRLAQSVAGLHPRALAEQLLPGAMSAHELETISRAESPATGLALLLVSPAFLRR